MIAILDYDAGNVASVQNACRLLGCDYELTRDPKTILAADHVILPGDGAFGASMDSLRKYGLVDVINQVASSGTPFLGICIGLQLLFDSSEETPGAEGLGLLKGRILRIPDCVAAPAGEIVQKVPHMGWNSLQLPRESRLFKGIPQDTYVYFVHSYYLSADDKSIVTATTEYGVKIEAAAEKDNVYATQFHPEKSGELGLKILKNFLEI